MKIRSWDILKAQMLKDANCPCIPHKIRRRLETGSSSKWNRWCRKVARSLCYHKNLTLEGK